MASLKEIIDELGQQAKQNNKPASRILKIKGLKRLVVQLNAVPNGNSVRYSMTLHSQNNYKKQIGITANDAKDLRIIADFLDKYADLLNEYVKFTRSGNSTPQVEELELTEEEEEQKSSQSQKKQQKKNVEDEF
ncbi:MAG: hypothetical protein L7G90_02755 [Candidatus Nanopusillus sp.]|nr:hypothetical protein [Candidatus Nanopusillus sp.]